MYEKFIVWFNPNSHTYYFFLKGIKENDFFFTKNKFKVMNRKEG